MFDFKELSSVNFCKRMFWCRLCINPLFAQLHPDLLHLPVTVKSLRVMRLKNLLCPLPTGCFEGYNLATVCALAS